MIPTFRLTWLQSLFRAKPFIRLERFSNDCRKTNTKIITLTNHNSNKQHDEPIRSPSNDMNLPKARGKSRLKAAIGFGFASHWLKNRCAIFKPITWRSNHNRAITFDSRLKNRSIIQQCCCVFCNIISAVSISVIKYNN